MSARHLILQGEPWRLVRLDDQAAATELSLGLTADPAAVARAVAEAAGAAAGGMILALDGRTALSARVSHAGGRTRHREALAFALEEHLPLSAEEFVGDYVVHKSHALAVAADLAQLEPIATALAERAIDVRCIAPLALLALQDLARRQDLRLVRLVVWQSENETDVFLLEGGRPVEWRLVAAEPQAVEREVRLLGDGLGAPKRAVTVNVNDEIAAAIRALGIDDEPLQLDRQPCAAAMAGRILAGRESAWIDLKRPPLADVDPLRPIRRRLRLLAAALSIAAFCVAAALWLRAAQYEALARRLQLEQEAVFAETFPGQRPPRGVRMRLESEQRKLAGLAGRLQGMPELESALATLERALGPLPADMRLRVLELRVEPGQAYLEGEVRQHGDADVIAGQLRAAGFDMAPPRTERLPEQGVSFVLNGQAVDQVAAAKESKP